MNTSLYRRSAVMASALICCAAILVGPGCRRDDGLSDRQKAEQVPLGAADALRAQGAKVTLLNSPIGDLWVVDLHGATVTDDTVKHLAGLKRVSELNLNRSTVTDAQLAALRDQGGTALFHKIDIGQTAVTDATLEWMAECRGLTDLTVTGSKVTPPAADRLKQKRKDSQNIPAMFKNTSVKL